MTRSPIGLFWTATNYIYIPLPFIVAFSLMPAVEVKVDKYEVVKLVGFGVGVVVVVVIVVVAVVKFGVLELFVMC